LNKESVKNDKNTARIFDSIGKGSKMGYIFRHALRYGNAQSLIMEMKTAIRICHEMALTLMYMLMTTYTNQSIPNEMWLNDSELDTLRQHECHKQSHVHYSAQDDTHNHMHQTDSFNKYHGP